MGLAVLITYHDEGELLGECLRSLDSDVIVPDEVRIFDDASEVPLEVAGTYRFPVKTVRSERNVGPSAARNALAELTSCEYIHFHDADDLFTAGWTRRILEVLEQAKSNPLDVIYYEVSTVAADGVTLQTERAQGMSSLRSGGDLVEFAIQRGALPTGAVYRRAAYAASGGFDPRVRLVEDFEFNVRFALSRPRFVVLDEPLVLYRRRPGSASSDLDALLVSVVNSIESLTARITEQRYRRVLSAKAAIIGTWLFQRGDAGSAARAFRAVTKLGGTDFRWRGLVYRIVARKVGPLAAERLSVGYRRLAPSWLRRGLDRLRRLT